MNSNDSFLLSVTLEVMNSGDVSWNKEVVLILSSWMTERDRYGGSIFKSLTETKKCHHQEGSGCITCFPMILCIYTQVRAFHIMHGRPMCAMALF